MNNYDKNSDLSSMDFPQRLSTLRKSRHLSRRDLANLSGLSEKTIYNIEKGNQKNTLQKTRMLIAEALEISLDELMGPEAETLPPPVPQTSRRKGPFWIGISTAMIVVLGLTLGTLWHQSCANAEWTLDNTGLTVRDKLLSSKLWEISGDGPPVNKCIVSPWNPQNLLVGTTRQAKAGGQLLCLERASGDTIWTVGPDIPAMTRAFGAEDVMSAQFSCKQITTADLDGDATPEIVITFTHGKYYPFATCIVSSDGTLRAQYANKGHLSQIVVTDIDGDQKDEIICVGTTNNKAYMGATLFILDDKHCNGASIDSLCNPWSSEPDSALIRTILPSYPAPYMQFMAGQRLAAFEPQIITGYGKDPVISVQMYGGNQLDKITVFFDSELRPVSAQADDSFLDSMTQWPDSLTTNTGPNDPAWLANWLAGYKRFEVGRWSP